MAYQGIFMMAEGTDSGICYMDSAEGMMDYCFQYVCQNTLIQEFGDEMYIKLCQGLEPNSFQEYINTISLLPIIRELAGGSRKTADPQKYPDLQVE